MHRTESPPDREGAFTLIEILVALAIFSIALTAIYGSFASALANKERAETQAQVFRTGRLAISRMAEDLQAAFYPNTGRAAPSQTKAKPLFRSLHFGDEDRPLDSIVFSTLSSRPTGIAGRETDQRVVTYFFPVEATSKWLEKNDSRAILFGGASRALLEMGPRMGSERSLFDKNTPLTLLRREVTPIGEEPADTEGAVAVFVENVAWLRLRFHDGEKWITAWDSEEASVFAPLPRAVEISLALYDREQAVELFSTAVTIPMAQAHQAKPVKEVER